MDTWLPLRDAASALGISQDACRRRLKAGTLQGRQEETAQGFRWLIRVDRAGEAAATPAPDVAPGGAQAPGGADLAAQRAREMAHYTSELLAPYVAKIEAQAERIGRLEAELEQARAPRAATPVDTQEDAGATFEKLEVVPAEQPRRRWWAWLWPVWTPATEG